MQALSAAPDMFRYALPHRLWRVLPAAARRRALARATAWLAPKAPSRHMSAPGIIVGGELSRPSGVGETARIMASCTRRLGLPTWTIDIPPLPFTRPTVPADLPPDVPLVLHVNAPSLPLALLRLPREARRRRRIIGYWAWELPDIPPDWLPALACVDEVWVPSAFTAAALRPALPGRVRIVVPPLALVPPVPQALDRAAFGLPQDAIVVLVSFSLASACSRKNPFGAIAAFRKAFGERPDRILLLKIGHPNHAPGDFARLRHLAQAPNIRIETRSLSPGARHALTAAADIVLSLHRAEGFGLVLAEAMLLGKPVVATRWSGNADYMDHENAVPVGFRLVPAQDDRGVYRGIWAEPDIGQAVEQLRRLADDRPLRVAIGGRARLAAQARFGPASLTQALGCVA